jgi:hypothetical protein
MVCQVRMISHYIKPANFDDDSRRVRDHAKPLLKPFRRPSVGLSVRTHDKSQEPLNVLS